MPQMAPLSWLLLYIIFTITFIMFCILNYYMMIPTAPSPISSNLKSQYSMNWKW